MKMYLPVFLNNCSNNLFFIGFVLLITAGCKSNGLPGKTDVIASYGREDLLREEVDFFKPDSLIGDDSIRFANQYIESWVEMQAIKEEALREIGQLPEDLKFKLRHYENQLIAHEFANWLVEERVDLTVTEADIRDYYSKFPDKYVSTANYYQFFYIKTEKPGQYKVVNLMRSKESEKIDELIEWAEENAVEYRLDSSYVSEPEIERLSKGFYFGNIRRASRTTVYPYSHAEDGDTYYDFFRLLNVIEVGDQLPLELCRTRIINSILHQRKNTLVKQSRADLVKKAKAGRKVEVFK